VEFDDVLIGQRLIRFFADAPSPVHDSSKKNTEQHSHKEDQSNHRRFNTTFTIGF
jgi:hypothetical protein